MYILIICIIILFSIVSLSFTEIGRRMSEFVRFFTEGKNKDFSFSDLRLIHRIGTYAGIENKTQIFRSVPVLDSYIKFITHQVENHINEQTVSPMQLILNKLYTYRTEVELEHMQKLRRLESTREIPPRQICIILVPNENTVYAKLVANKKDSLIFNLFDASSERAKTINWQGKFIRVYFWRQKDAGYIFASNAIGARRIGNCTELSIRHSNKLARTQKRKSIRATCNFEAHIFPLYDTDAYDSEYITSGGVKCILSNISEDGAMIFARGKAVKGVRIKLQFKIKNIPLVMCGRIVRFMYDQSTNKSRIHFQCEFLEQKMKNIILSYVYNIGSEDSNEFINSVFKKEKRNVEQFVTPYNMELIDLEE